MLTFFLYIDLFSTPLPTQWRNFVKTQLQDPRTNSYFNKIKTITLLKPKTFIFKI